jgi:hypothetical protein
MANNAVIEAAKIANQPEAPNGLLTGFVQGIGALATGLIKRADDAKKQAKILKNAYTGKTDIKGVADLVYTTQQRVKTDPNFTVDDGVERLKSFSYDVNTYLPSIEKKFRELSAKGFSNAANPLLENLITSYTLGELDGPINVDFNDGQGQRSYPTFIKPDKNGDLTMLTKDGTYQPFSAALADLESIVDINDGDKGTKFVTNFIGQKYNYGEQSKWQEDSDELMTNITNEMKDPNAKLSMLFDNSVIVKGKEYNFSNHYMQNGMSKEERETINNGLKNLKSKDPRVIERTKAMLVQNIMKDDENLETDIQDYWKSIIDLKKPKKPNAGPAIGEVFDTSISNVENYNINRLLTLFKKGSDGTELGDLEIYRQDVGGGKIQLKRKNKQGEEAKDEVLGFSFDPTNKDEVIKMLPYIQRILFGKSTSKELYAIKNFEAYLTKHPEILTN